MSTWAVGTENRAKVQCVSSVVEKCFPGKKHNIIPISVESGVSAQPMSAEESQRGAIHRAQEALRLVATAEYGVGLEGGLEHIGDKWFECGWMAVIQRSSGRCGLGSSARFEMSPTLMNPILNESKELSEVIDSLSGKVDVRSTLGAMGILTDGHLGRAAAYEHGLIFALAPFLSDAKYW